MKGNVIHKTDFLTKKQEQGILALISSASTKDAALACGVSEVTLWRWLQVEEFQQAYMTARREAVRLAIARLQQTSGEAVDVLRDVMKDTTVTPAARVSAAKSILEMAFKAVEIEDLATRLAQLEQAFEQQAKK
jgi:hypothetical protein